MAKSFARDDRRAEEAVQTDTRLLPTSGIESPTTASRKTHKAATAIREAASGVVAAFAHQLADSHQLTVFLHRKSSLAQCRPSRPARTDRVPARTRSRSHSNSSHAASARRRISASRSMSPRRRLSCALPTPLVPTSAVSRCAAAPSLASRARSDLLSRRPISTLSRTLTRTSCSSCRRWQRSTTS